MRDLGILKGIFGPIDEGKHLLGYSKILEFRGILH